MSGGSIVIGNAMQRFVLCLAVLLLTSCGGRRVRNTQTTNAAETTTLAVGGGADTAAGTPSEQVSQLTQLLARGSYAPVTTALEGTLEEGGISAYALDLQPSTCYVLVGVADSQNDLNLVMLDPLGRDIAHDVRANPHPWVSFCTVRAGRFTARLQMLRGAGPFHFAAFFAARGQPATLAAFFADEPSASQVESATIDSATSQRLAALDQTLGSQSFRRVGDPNGVVLETNQRRDFEARLEAGRCYVFAALGGPSATSVSVAVASNGGQVVSASETAAQDAQVRLCNVTAGTYRLQVQIRQGQGAVFTAGYAQGGAQPTEVISANSTAAATLDENFALLDADMRARGYLPFGLTARDQLEASGQRRTTVELEARRCYAFVAMGDSTVENLDLSLLAANGSPIDRDQRRDARPIVRHCTTVGGTFTMEVAMRAGSGPYVLTSYRWPGGLEGPFGLEGLLYVRYAEITSLLTTEGFVPDFNFELVRGQLRSGPSTHSVQLSAGRCYSVVVVGGEGIRNIDARLSDGSDLVVADSDDNAFTSLRTCTDEAEELSLRISSTDRGPFLYQVFSQQTGG